MDIELATSGWRVVALANWAMTNIGKKREIWRIEDFVVTATLEKKTPFALSWWASGEGCNTFSKHLDLALAPNKTNEGVY